MKTLILVSFLILPFGLSAQQYPTPDYPEQKNAESEVQADEKKEPVIPEQKAENAANLLQKKLGLTEEQKQKVYDLNLNRINQIRAIKAKKMTDEKANKDAFQKIKTDYDKAMTALLNDDQQKLWIQLKMDQQAKKTAQHKSQSKGVKAKPIEEESDLYID